MRTSSAFTFFTSLALAAAESASVTPHDSYSSSVGVLGCKINTNRVAYWPMAVDCNNICVKLSYQGRSVHLLRIDQSGGAYDISYDAWNYLQTGKSATEDPISGGGVAMEYETVDASECADLIYTDSKKLPLSASNSMGYAAGCMSESGSWVGQNFELYNICDPLCSLGHDEVCTLDLSVSNQASCAHQLGLQDKLTTAPVYNIEYQSGKVVNAATGQAGSASDIPAESDAGSSGSQAQPAVAESAPTTTAAAKVDATPGVFQEVYSASSSVESITVASAYPTTLEVPSSTLVYSASSSAPAEYTTSSYSAAAPTTESAVPTYLTTAVYQNQTSTYAVSKSTGGVYTTMSTVTAQNPTSGSTGTTTGSVPVQTVSAANSAMVGSVLASFSGVIICLLFTAI